MKTTRLIREYPFFFNFVRLLLKTVNFYHFSVEDALKKQHRKLPSGRPEKKYKQLLENKFAHINGTPNWAKLDHEKKGSESDDSDNEILKVSL